jgi:hypothetical protein
MILFGGVKAAELFSVLSPMGQDIVGDNNHHQEKEV